MGKLLAAGGVVLVVLVVLLLHLMKGTTEVGAAPPAPVATRPPDSIAPTPHILAPQPAGTDRPVDERPGKINPYSHAFQFEFDDVQPKRLLQEAAKCYTGGINRVGRDAKLKLTFKDKIVDGEVTLFDLKVVDDTLNNKALADCFVEKVSRYHWHKDELPNWEQDDMLLIRPERGMKKYLPESVSYEGDGPEFPGGKAVEPVRRAEPELTPGNSP